MEEEAADLVGLLDAWADAIVANDADAIASYMDPEWVIVSETGVSSREDFLNLVRTGALTHSAMRRVGPSRVQVYGDTAVVTARVTNTAHYEGKSVRRRRMDHGRPGAPRRPLAVRAEPDQFGRAGYW